MEEKSETHKNKGLLVLLSFHSKEYNWNFLK